MLGSYLYRFTIGNLGCILGAPIFLACYFYLGGMFAFIFFDGWYNLTPGKYLNPLYMYQYWYGGWVYLWQNWGSVGIDYWGFMFLSAILPLFIFRILRIPIMLIIYVVTWPFRGKQITEEELRQAERELLKEELKGEVLEELQQSQEPEERQDDDPSLK